MINTMMQCFEIFLMTSSWELVGCEPVEDVYFCSQEISVPAAAHCVEQEAFAGKAALRHIASKSGKAQLERLPTLPSHA